MLRVIVSCPSTKTKSIVGILSNTKNFSCNKRMEVNLKLMSYDEFLLEIRFFFNPKTRWSRLCRQSGYEKHLSETEKHKRRLYIIEIPSVSRAIICWTPSMWVQCRPKYAVATPGVRIRSSRLSSVVAERSYALASVHSSHNSWG